MPVNETSGILRYKDAEGNSNILYPVTTADHVDGLDELELSILNKIHPVGSVYMSLSDIDPSELFGIGTWERIQNMFLLGASDVYPVGSTGGEVNHLLTIEEMPKHNHKVKTDINNSDYNMTWDPWTEWTTGYTQVADETEACPNGTTFVGGDVPHNNMPPYLAVYMWKRVE